MEMSEMKRVRNQLSTFDLKSKSAKIQNSLCQRRVGGSRNQLLLLILSVNLLKSRIPFVNRGGEWGGGGGVADYVRHLVRIWGELQNFDNKIFHQAKASASKIVSVRRPKKLCNLQKSYAT